jgi:hypothetical protein
MVVNDSGLRIVVRVKKVQKKVEFEEVFFFSLLQARSLTVIGLEFYRFVLKRI